MTYFEDYDHESGGWDDQTECEGCGAGGPYPKCVCPDDEAEDPATATRDGWPLVEDYRPEQTEPEDLCPTS